MTERPMFDDEHLPEWLVAGGITFAGRARSATDADVPPWARPQSRLATLLPEFEPPADDAPPPWSAAAASVELPAFEPPAESVPPIFQAELPDSSAVASASAESDAFADISTPWDDVPATQSAPSDDPFADLDWMQESPAAAQTDQPAAPTFQTSWLSETLLPEQDSAAQAAASTFQTDWLSADSADDSAQTAAPTFQTDWLKEIDAAESPALGQQAESEQQAASADSIDWLSDIGLGSDFEPLGVADADPTAESAPTLIKPPAFDWQPEADALSEVADDWLRDFGAADEIAQPIDTSDWLDQLQLSTAPAAEPLPDWLTEQPPLVSDAAAQAADDLPDWLSDDVAESPAEPSFEEDVPEWLRTDYPEPRQAAPVTPPPEPEPPLDAELPAWMRELAPEPPPRAGLMGSSADPDDMAWLDQLDLQAPAAPVPTDIPKPNQAMRRSAEADIDLSDLDLDAILSDAPDFNLPEPSAAPINLDEEFDFAALPELPPSPPEAPIQPPPAPLPSVPTSPSRETGEVAVAAELPEWLAELRPDRKPTLRIGDQEIELEERPLADLPEPMLALRERLKQLPSASATEENKDSPLSGIPEVLQPIPLTAIPTPLAPSSALATATQLAGVQSLRKIVAAQEAILKQRETAEISAPAHVKPRARFKFDRLLLTVFLVVVVILPFFTDLATLVPAPRLADLDAATQARLSAVSAALESIPNGSVALVAFEYTPTAVGEMDDLARALLRDLFRRGVRPIVLSTSPAAALHAQHLLYRLSRSAAEMALLSRREPLLPRRDYVVLGYLPGGVSGVRALANALYDDSLQQQVIFGSDLEGAPSDITPEQLRALRVNPTFVLAQSQEDVRTWVEQFRPPPEAPELRMVIATTAAASVAAQTYAAAAPDSVVGALSGLRDALLYRELRAQYADSEAQRAAERRWQSVGFAAFAAALAILIGAALNMVQFLVQRRRAQ
jgi:hypothetical protein